MLECWVGRDQLIHKIYTIIWLNQKHAHFVKITTINYYYISFKDMKKTQNINIFTKSNEKYQQYT